MVLPNFEHINTHLPAAALKATRNAALLPADISFHKSMDPDFAKDLDEFSSKVLSITNRLLELASTIDSSGKGKGRLHNVDDVLDNFESCVVDRVDQLLERVDASLDEYLGRSKAPAIAINLAVDKKKPLGKNSDVVVQHAAHLQKPQLSFKQPIDNSNGPWYPQLKHKYNATIPLGQNVIEQDETDSSSPLTSHPYRYEIKHISYPPRMFSQSSPIPPKPFESTSFTWVDTSEALSAMLSKLRQASEIAVDLEHHSYRTYSGFLCLMQLSTREEDWIVDTLVLRHELEVLNEVFTDPKIIKVFHGADSDIVWLQQDLNLYVVNLFDTYHASKVLSFPKHGLANLLEMYCDFTPDKRYQLADWRVRPLPEPMLRYARSDTHFLLYIYDNLRNALLDRAESQSRSSPSPPPADHLVRDVLASSNETALKVYDKEIYDAVGGSGSSGWDTLARKWNKVALVSSASDVGAAAVQKYVYKAVHGWRDAVAREEDESTRFILPNHFLFQLAESPPPDLAVLLRIFHSPPPVIKRRAKELLEVIRDAVKANFSHSASVEASQPVEPAKEATPLPEPETMTTLPAQSTLWSSSAPAVKSELLAKVKASTSSPTLLAAPKSSLFGSIPRKSVSRVPSDGQWLEAVNRIHSSLSVAPSLPQVTPKEDEEVVDSDPKNESLQVEVPFVPAAQRLKREDVDDSLVVVGQSKQKKRKRTGGAEQSTSKKPKSVSGSEEPFDFSSVPNVLDQLPDTQEDTRVKKKGKQKKGGTGYTYGNFPAPPKAQSELKSGNQSHTFS